MTEPCDLSAVEARRLIGERKLSPVELLESCIARIEKTNAAVNCDRGNGRGRGAQAGEGDRAGDRPRRRCGPAGGTADRREGPAGNRRAAGPRGARCCSRTTCRPRTSSTSPISAGPAASSSARPTRRSSAPAPTPPTASTARPAIPSIPTKTCAGSSGGSAVALALGQVALATGSDLGGSLRTPASFCGVAGFRPSPGVVPMRRPAGEPQRPSA